jgi:ABC-type nitrate/sulfonate/bicarbonate transport system substrate-binding protein
MINASTMRLTRPGRPHWLSGLTRAIKYTAARLSVAVATFAILTASGYHVARAADPIKIFVPISTIGWGFYLAEKKGYFKAAGVDADVRAFSSGGEAAQAFQALKADVLEAGDMPSMLLAAGAGGNAKIIAQVARSAHAIQLIGPTSIKGPADLKGKTVATIFGATNEYYIRKYLKENGITDQVKVINLDPGSQIPALLRGDVDAIVTFLSFGVQVIRNPKFHIIDSWPSSLMLVISKSFADSRPASVDGVLKALQRAADEIKADPKAAVAAVSGMHGLVDKAYEADLSSGGIDVTPQYPASTQDFLQGVAGFLVQQGRLKQPFDFCGLVDLSYLRKLNPATAGGAPTCKS